MRRALSTIRFRWILVAVYTMVGALALVHLLFLSLDALPGGLFYAGFGLSSLIGAALASRQSRGTSLVEGMIAAVIVGLVQLVILLIRAPMDELSFMTQIRAPLSTTFVCFAGALAGGRLGALSKVVAREDGKPPWHLTAMATLLLIGTLAGHVLMILPLSYLLPPRGLLIFVAVVLVISSPAVAGLSLQLVAKRDVLGAFTRAVIVMSVCSLVIASFDDGPSAALIVGGGVALLFGGLFTLGLVNLGAGFVRPWEPELDGNASGVPRAVVHADDGADSQRLI